MKNRLGANRPGDGTSLRRIVHVAKRPGLVAECPGGELSEWRNVHKSIGPRLLLNAKLFVIEKQPITFDWF